MMNKESFWDAVERKQGSIEPFFKLLLGQRNVSTFLSFASLTDEDIKELCEDAQDHISNLHIADNDFKALQECQPNLTTNFKLSVAFKATIKSICRLVTRMSFDDLMKLPAKKRNSNSTNTTDENVDDNISSEPGTSFSQANLQLSEDEKTVWINKLKAKSVEVIGANLIDDISLTLLQRQAKRDVVQIVCPIENCRDTSRVYKEKSGKAGKYQLHTFVSHLKRKHGRGILTASNVSNQGNIPNDLDSGIDTENMNERENSLDSSAVN